VSSASNRGPYCHRIAGLQDHVLADRRGLKYTVEQDEMASLRGYVVLIEQGANGRSLGNFDVRHVPLGPRWQKGAQ
jgi:hypothetical protein